MRPRIRIVYKWPGRIALVLAVLLGYWLGSRGSDTKQLQGMAQMQVIAQKEHQRLGSKLDEALKPLEPREGELPGVGR